MLPVRENDEDKNTEKLVLGRKVELTFSLDDHYISLFVSGTRWQQMYDWKQLNKIKLRVGLEKVPTNIFVSVLFRLVTIFGSKFNWYGRGVECC